MTMLLLRWILNTLALFVVTYLFSGIHASSVVVLAIAALILGLLNAVVRPLLFFLNIPLTVITLGLFLIVLNGIMLELTALLVPGFGIDTFWSAIGGGIVLGLLSLVTNRIGTKGEKPKPKRNRA